MPAPSYSWTNETEHALIAAREVAGLPGHPSVTPEHLLLGVARTPDGAGDALVVTFFALRAVLAG